MTDKDIELCRKDNFLIISFLKELLENQAKLLEKIEKCPAYEIHNDSLKRIFATYDHALKAQGFEQDESLPFLFDSTSEFPEN